MRRILLKTKSFKWTFLKKEDKISKQNFFCQFLQKENRDEKREDVRFMTFRALCLTKLGAPFLMSTFFRIDDGPFAIHNASKTFGFLRSIT